MLTIDLSAPGDASDSEFLADLLRIIKRARASARVFTHTVVVGNVTYVLSTSIKDISLYIAGSDDDGRETLVRFIREQFSQHSSAEMVLGHGGEDADNSGKKEGPKGLYITAVAGANKYTFASAN